MTRGSRKDRDGGERRVRSWSLLFPMDGLWASADISTLYFLFFFPGEGAQRRLVLPWLGAVSPPGPRVQLGREDPQHETSRGRPRPHKVNVETGRNGISHLLCAGCLVLTLTVFSYSLCS